MLQLVEGILRVVALLGKVVYLVSLVVSFLAVLYQ